MTEAYELIATQDGSFTCINKEHNELFHNSAGAFSEAFKNYYEPSCAWNIICSNGSLALLDVCFGLGYNSFVLLNEIIKKRELDNIRDNQTIYILGLELSSEVLKNIPNILKDSRFSYIYSLLSKSLPDNFGTTSIKTNTLEITIEICSCDIREAIPKLNTNFDLIFHDPFSPNRVPALWTIDLFKEYYRLLLLTKGKLLTYSSAAAVRGGLKEVGFHIYRTAALGKKTGGTLASINEQSGNTHTISKLSAEELEKINSISGIPYRDPSFKADRIDIINRRGKEQEAKR